MSELIKHGQVHAWDETEKTWIPAELGLGSGTIFHASAYDELTVTVPAPAFAPTLIGGNQGWADFLAGHTYDFVQTYVGWNGETQASSAASITPTYDCAIGVLPTAPRATRAAGAKIYVRDNGGAWHLADITFLTAAGDSRILGFAKPTGDGVIMIKNASGATVPASNTATDRDATAISNPSTTPILTVLGGMPPSTTFYGAMSYTAEDGTESALSPISAGYTTNGGAGAQMVEMGHPAASRPNGVVFINYYLGTSATAGAMKKQLTAPANIISPRIETYNASGAAHSAGTAQSRISGFQQALDAAVAAGDGLVLATADDQSYVPIFFRHTAHGIKVKGVGTSGFLGGHGSSVSYEGALSGVAFAIYEGFGWSIEGIEFLDPNNRVVAGLGYSSITGGAAFVAKWTECSFQAFAAGGVGIHAPNEGRFLLGSHNASEQTFVRCSAAGNAWGLKVHSNQSGNFIFEDCWSATQGNGGSADSGEAYLAGFFGNSLFNFTSISGLGAYIYYMGGAPPLDNAWGGFLDLTIERNYSETSIANCDVFIDSTASNPSDVNLVPVTLRNNRFQNVTGHERLSVCAHGPAKVVIIGRHQGGNILFTNPDSFLDSSAGIFRGYFKQPTPTYPPTSGGEMLTNGPIVLINKNGDKVYASVNDSGDIVLTPKSGRGIVIPDDAYDATTWNGSLAIPTKNAIRDRMETLLGGVTGAYDTLVEVETVLANIVSVWTAWTPTLFTDIGNQATSFSSVTLGVCRYKLIGKTLFLQFDISGTLNAVTPAYLGLSLPTGSTQNNATFSSIGVLNGATYEAGFARPVTTGVRCFRLQFGNYTSGAAVQAIGSITVELA